MVGAVITCFSDGLMILPLFLSLLCCSSSSWSKRPSFDLNDAKLMAHDVAGFDDLLFQECHDGSNGCVGEFNVSDNFRGRWKIFPNISTAVAPFVLPVTNGAVHMKLRQGEYVVPHELAIVSGEAILADFSRILLHGLYFRSRSLVMGLANAEEVMLLENVHMNLPQDDLSPENVLNLLKKLNSSITSPSVPLHDQRSCYYSFCFRVVGIKEFGEPDWRRKEVREIGSANPYLQLHGILYSPNCAIHVNIDTSSVFSRSDEQRGQAYGLVVFVLLVGFAFSLFEQMRKSEASSLIASKISGFCVGMLVFVDSYFVMFHFLAGLVISRNFLLFSLLGFTELMLFIFYELKFFVIIWRQNVSRQLQENARIYYFRTYVAVFVAFFLFFNIPGVWYVFVMLFYSFWVPQIVQNIVSGASSPLSWSFILWGSLLRIFPLLYFSGYEGNILFFPQKRWFGIVLSLWMIFQWLVMLAQQKFGPRCFIPKNVFPGKNGRFVCCTGLHNNRQCSSLRLQKRRCS